MKTWPSTILAAAIILATAIVYTGLNTAESQQRGAGFMVASGAASYTWRVNTVTGAVSYCVRRSDSNDPGYIAETPPVCSAWSEAVQ
jgi:hypothetical protein